MWSPNNYFIAFAFELFVNPIFDLFEGVSLFTNIKRSIIVAVNIVGAVVDHIDKNVSR